MTIRRTAALALLPVVLGSAGLSGSTACSREAPATPPTQEETVEASYNATLDEVEDRFEDCVVEGTCRSLALSSLKLQARKPIFGKRGKICDVLRPFRGLEHVYAFVGVSATAGVPWIVVQAGTDLVWDLWNMQAANFGYTGAGMALLVGGGIDFYAGYAMAPGPLVFWRSPPPAIPADVIAAWSGQFGTVSFGVSASVASVGAQLFASPDFAIMGGTGNVGLGLQLESPWYAGAVFGLWEGYDDGTSALADGPWRWLNYVKPLPTSMGKKYVQFNTVVSQSLSLLMFAGAAAVAGGGPANPLAVQLTVFANTGIAIQTLKAAGLTPSSYCGLPPPTPAPPAMNPGMIPPPVVAGTGVGKCAKSGASQKVPGSWSVDTRGFTVTPFSSSPWTLEGMGTGCSTAWYAMRSAPGSAPGSMKQGTMSLSQSETCTWQLLMTGVCADDITPASWTYTPVGDVSADAPTTFKLANSPPCAGAPSEIVLTPAGERSCSVTLPH